MMKKTDTFLFKRSFIFQRAISRKLQNSKL